MKYGWMTINITDMWNKPNYNSERINQLLFSDFIKIRNESNGFYLIEKQDKYRGWVDKRFIKICSSQYYSKFTKKKKYVVIAKSISISNIQKRKCNPYCLYYGTTFTGSKIQNGKVEISLPDKKSFLVSSNSVSLIPNKNCLTSELLKETKRFLGVPYLWGGVTSLGFDCSGFVQTILSRYGISVPRDTKDQIKIGKDIKRDHSRNGDLLFFKRHVGFAIGKNKIIHASVGGGGVRINSILPNTIDYIEDLDQTFKTARRIF